MPERNTETMNQIRMGEDLRKRLRIRCDELDTTIQDQVVELLAAALFEGRESPRTVAGGTPRER